MKKWIALFLCMVLMLNCLPLSAFAKSKQMNDDVPVWDEDTVRQYALDYIAGADMTRLWNYYDLQIRRYMPQRAFESFLIDLEFLTGDFQALGSYRSFEETPNQLKTHVLHLCMEKQDVDMYFTHKNKEDDWEIMALEFVLSNEEESVEEQAVSGNSYQEKAVTIGSDAYPLEGILTMPDSADSNAPVPACVLVHDFGAYDRDHTIGQTKMFRDLAAEMAEMGIASVRYDKRTYAYPDATVDTVWHEVVEDALSAVELLANDKRVDQQRIVVIGVGLGAITAPRIAEQSEKKVTGVIMIGGILDSLLNIVYKRSEKYLATLTKEEKSEIQNIVRNFNQYSDKAVLEMELLGRNAYYYREADQYPQTRTIRKLGIPIYIVQGRQDPIVSEDDGRRVYYEQVGSYAQYEVFRGLNHLLMNDLTTNQDGEPEYQVAANVDKHAARTLANWILAIHKE